MASTWIQVRWKSSDESRISTLQECTHSLLSLRLRRPRPLVSHSLSRSCSNWLPSTRLWVLRSRLWSEISKNLQSLLLWSLLWLARLPRSASLHGGTFLLRQIHQLAHQDLLVRRPMFRRRLHHLSEDNRSGARTFATSGCVWCKTANVVITPSRAFFKEVTGSASLMEILMIATIHTRLRSSISTGVMG